MFIERSSPSRPASVSCADSPADVLGCTCGLVFTCGVRASRESLAAPYGRAVLRCEATSGRPAAALRDRDNSRRGARTHLDPGGYRGGPEQGCPEPPRHATSRTWPHDADIPHRYEWGVSGDDRDRPPASLTPRTPHCLPRGETRRRRHRRPYARVAVEDRATEPPEPAGRPVGGRLTAPTAGPDGAERDGSPRSPDPEGGESVDAMSERMSMRQPVRRAASRAF